MDQRTRRSPARFLAPLALIAVVAAFLGVVNGSGGADSNGSDKASSSTSTSAAKSTTTAAGSSTTTAAKQKAAKKDFYTVQVGDTLGGIADKTGVPLETIEELNPNVDPHTMNSGQKIRLK